MFCLRFQSYIYPIGCSYQFFPRDTVAPPTFENSIGVEGGKIMHPL